MAGVEDYYHLLGVPYGANRDLVSRRFRTLAKTYHPDNGVTGNPDIFQRIHKAYKTLTSTRDRVFYDKAYEEYKQKTTHKAVLQFPEKVFLSAQRIHYPSNIQSLARKGLMAKGLRTKDRKKWTGIYHDLVLRIKRMEVFSTVIARIPLTVRVVCPECMGSDILCPACDGQGCYKSSRDLLLTIPPQFARRHRFITVDLSKFRPDKYTHFKKKSLKIHLEFLD